MKKLILPLLILSLTVAGCSRDDSPSDENNTTPRVITPHSAEEQTGTEISHEIQTEEQQSLVPMIELPPDEIIVKIQDINLDSDTEEEQIILTRKKNSETDTDEIRIYIADYNNDSMTYRKALKTVITPDSTEGISILVQDLTANHQNEVIVTGFTSYGNHTLDSYRVVTQGGREGLTYAPIAGLNINGSIDVQTADRSQNYRSGHNTDESFPIITEETDTGSDNNLDLIKTTYKWRSSSRRYVPVSVDKIPGISIQEEQLEKLYKGDLEGFTTFLSGPWHRVEDLSRRKQPFLEEIIYFQPEDEQIIFSKDDIQEIYNWNDTYRTIFKGIYIQSRNTLINSLRKDIYVTVEGMEKIRVKIQGSTEWGEWGGFYEPVNKDLQLSLLQNTGIEFTDELSRLSGLFRSNRGEDLYLDLPYFTIRSENRETARGVIVFYTLHDSTILEMRYLKENGLLESRSVYSVNYNETSDNKRIIRTLTLNPGHLTVTGFLQSPGEAVHYEQIEIRESDPET